MGVKLALFLALLNFPHNMVVVLGLLRSGLYLLQTNRRIQNINTISVKYLAYTTTNYI